MDLGLGGLGVVLVHWCAWMGPRPAVVSGGLKAADVLVGGAVSLSDYLLGLA